MTKPIVHTAPCGSNTATKGKFAEVVSNLARDCANDAGVIKGVFVCDKDSNNNVGIVDDALMKIPVIASATYSYGTTLYGTSSGVATSGTKVIGFAAETKTLTTSQALLVRLDIN